MQQEIGGMLEPRTACAVCRQRANDLFTDLQHELTESQLLQLAPGQEFRQFSAVVIMQGSLVLQTYASPGGQVVFASGLNCPAHVCMQHTVGRIRQSPAGLRCLTIGRVSAKLPCAHIFVPSSTVGCSPAEH